MLGNDGPLSKLMPGLKTGLGGMVLGSVAGQLAKNKDDVMLTCCLSTIKAEEMTEEFSNDRIECTVCVKFFE